MGLAASQGRYLCLTARMNDLIYEGQQISQQRLALANETKAVADEYNEAMSNTKLQATVLNSSNDFANQTLTFDILTSQDPFQGLCMRIVDTNGNVVVPSKKEVMKCSDGTEVSFKEFSQNKDPEKLKQEGYVDENGLSYEYVDKNAYLKSEDERYLFDENCLDPTYLSEMITSGEWMIQKAKPNNEGWEDNLWQGSNNIAEVYDTSDDAAAEAKYDAATREIQRQDKLLELRLQQVETSEKAVEKELDSVKQIISKNVEDSFKTFA